MATESPLPALEPTSTTTLPPAQQIYERFSLAPTTRISTGGGLAYGIGFFLGLTQGARTSGLRFRAENSHRLPTNQRGWYLYHRAKNGYIIKCGFAEGNRMGWRLVPWVVMFFGIEEAMDTLRLKEDGGDERKDFVSTIVAGVTVAGAFSTWKRLPMVYAARTAKMGLAVGLGFGLVQDVVHLMRGHRLAYVDLVGRLFGLKRSGARMANEGT